MIYYIETNSHCCLEEAKSLEQAKEQVAADVGINNIRVARQATKKDIAWVEGMGGWIPTSLRRTGEVKK